MRFGLTFAVNGLTILLSDAAELEALLNVKAPTEGVKRKRRGVRARLLCAKSAIGHRSMSRQPFVHNSEGTILN